MTVIYTVHPTYNPNKTNTYYFTEEEFNEWKRKMAAEHYNMYRIVGDPNSDHYFLDFENMWEVTKGNYFTK